MYDLLILGAGPAGLTAAIYAARAGLRFAVLEQDGWGGGQISSAHQVQNYPGVPEISGADLGEKLRQQAEALGTEVLCAEISCVERYGGGFRLTSAEGEQFQAKAVIAATGAYPKKLGLAGEEALTGAGVSYCAVCDGAFYAGKDVLVVGGGDTAVEDALYLSPICKSVTVLLRRAVFRAARTRVDLLLKQPNVTVLTNTTVAALHGRERLEAVTLQTEGESREVPADGLFVAVGHVPATDCLRELPLRLESGYVAAGEDCVTTVPGLFAAGDIRTKPLRQAVTAAADGANAANSAIAYLMNFEAGGWEKTRRDQPVS